MLKKVGHLLTSAKRNRKGFTLVELMIVVVIIGILAAVVAPRFFESASDARASAHQANRVMLTAAVERYHADTTLWPSANLQELDDVAAPGNLPAGAVWNGPYIQQIPAIPAGIAAAGVIYQWNGTIITPQ